MNPLKNAYYAGILGTGLGGLAGGLASINDEDVSPLSGIAMGSFLGAMGGAGLAGLGSKGHNLVDIRKPIMGLVKDPRPTYIGRTMGGASAGALAGGLFGGVQGGVRSLLSDGDFEDAVEGGLTGALAGGGLGALAGVGLARKARQQNIARAGLMKALSKAAPIKAIDYPLFLAH